MGGRQINITLGTAGHIDHGKTVLVKCLTGCETDRLKAEKERGMSIELGFAPCTIGEHEVGIVDVPGHENFIKTMVAGAIGIDGTIFVIAADDGIMPQTREHLEILTLLGITKGIVALTKCDCVAKEQLAKRKKEVKDFLKGTLLENAPVVVVSGVTGQGLNEFYEGLKTLVNELEPKITEGIFRVPIERAFSLKGFGTVVTGIPVSGSVKVGQEVMLLPQKAEGRIKTIQVYGKDSDRALCSQCAALNVPQWDYKTIERGNVVTVKNYFEPRNWYLCKIQILQSCKTPVKHASCLTFHTGTSKVNGALYLMESNKISAGQKQLGQIKLYESITAGPGDPFVIRSVSPPRTIGGGMIIEPLLKKLRRSKSSIADDAKKRAKAVLCNMDFAEYSLQTAEGLAATELDISMRLKQPASVVNKLLSKLVEEKKAIPLNSKQYIHYNIAEQTKEQLLGIVKRFHNHNPESPGITKDKLWQTAGLQKDLFDGIINLLLSEAKLVERKHCIALAEHQETFSRKDKKLLESIESLFINRLFNPPKLKEIVQQTDSDEKEVEKILRILLEQERLVEVDKKLLFHCKAVEEGKEILRSFIEKEGRLESVKFKYLLDTTRKFAIPLLDYFDTIGLTNRVGNTRYLKK